MPVNVVHCIKLYLYFTNFVLSLNLLGCLAQNEPAYKKLGARQDSELISMDFDEFIQTLLTCEKCVKRIYKIRL